MKVRLSKRVMLRDLPSEEDLLDGSFTETIYVIRKLKALIESEFYGSIEVSNEANEHGQRFSKQFNIWFNKEEMRC